MNSARPTLQVMFLIDDTGSNFDTFIIIRRDKWRRKVDKIFKVKGLKKAAPKAIH